MTGQAGYRNHFGTEFSKMNTHYMVPKLPGVYCLENKINGKKYIGKKKYMKGWETYLGSGILLKEAIKKYGEKNY